MEGRSLLCCDVIDSASRGLVVFIHTTIKERKNGDSG